VERRRFDVRSTLVKQFLDEEGATMVEYAVMLMLIALVCFGTVGHIGEVVAAKYQNLVEKWPGD
jgi:Flp pilus assembly pilin Flp